MHFLGRNLSLSETESKCVSIWAEEIGKMGADGGTSALPSLPSLVLAACHNDLPQRMPRARGAPAASPHSAYALCPPQRMP